jgi:hypothetical protein
MKNDLISHEGSKAMDWIYYYVECFTATKSLCMLSSSQAIYQVSDQYCLSI